MYIDSIHIKDFRVFADTRVRFRRPGSSRRPGLANMNVLLGNNGSGKTTLLRAIALAALGPSVADSGIFPYRLIRRTPTGGNGQPQKAMLEARFEAHEQEGLLNGARLESMVAVQRKGDLETLRWVLPDADEAWDRIYTAESQAFFFVGYGATRRIEKREYFDESGRKASRFARAQRVQGLFDDAYSLVPLQTWLPSLRAQNPGRFNQAVRLLNATIGADRLRFTGELDDGEYVFERRGLKVPFACLSDGYRAYLGWVADLLYHVCATCPPGKRLVENRGIVMVDEIDLHLHPAWQLTVLGTLARAFPNLQFIATTHSPLIVGSLDRANILVMRPGPSQSARVTRLRASPFGLDADQVLLTDYFGLESTRAPSARDRLKELALKARLGDRKAARDLLTAMGGTTEKAE